MGKVSVECRPKVVTTCCLRFLSSKQQLYGLSINIFLRLTLLPHLRYPL